MNWEIIGAAISGGVISQLAAPIFSGIFGLRTKQSVDGNNAVEHFHKRLLVVEERVEKLERVKVEYDALVPSMRRVARAIRRHQQPDDEALTQIENVKTSSQLMQGSS